MKCRLKGKIQLHLFLFGFRKSYFLGFVGLILGITGSIIESPSSIASISISIVSTFFCLFLFVKDSREIKRAESNFFQIEKDPNLLKSLNKSDQYKNYEFIEFREHYALYCPEVNRLLNRTFMDYELEPKKFNTCPTAKSLAPFVVRTSFKSEKILFNSPKVRLKSDITLKAIQSDRKVFLMRTDYFSGLCTNEITCIEFYSRVPKNLLFDGLSFMSNNGIILDLQESKCSNHIGVSTIGFTNDMKLIVTAQSSESAQSANLLAPSGPGSADFNDLKDQSKIFQSFITRAMERELIEECGINNMMNGLIKTHLIGFARHLNRGGKPEFFGVSFINVPSDSLRITNKEAVFIADIKDIKVNRVNDQELKASLDKFQKEHQSSFSLLLYINLKFLNDYINSSPDSFIKLFNL
jgi:hypothetical protein